ncbi:hypothetical protein NMG60_11013502 [Bertholletia excelsa]
MLNKKSWLMPFLLLQIIVSEASINLGGGIGVGIVIGSPSAGGGGCDDQCGSSVSRLKKAYTALQAWKSAITDDPNGVLDSWIGSDVCNYRGIFCSDASAELGGEETGQVVAAIDLNRANLEGTLVPQLSLLTELSILHLNSNRFTGSVPQSFKALTSLSELDLSNNQFSGPFPTQALSIPRLKYLDLRYNDFTGPIPDELFNRGLDAIFLNNNQFSGEVPENLGNSPASVINLANNRFSGELPFSLNYMGPRLKEILFLNNQLTGCLPEGVGLWKDLQVLDVSFNSLMGQLPDSLSCLEDIEVLNLGHNKLSGELPDVVCSLENLMNLTVSYNFLSGFSDKCSKLSSRKVGFDFSSNCIPGRIMQRPSPECATVPRGGLNCLRVPAVKPLVCGALANGEQASPGPESP